MKKSLFKVFIIGILFSPKARKILIGKNLGDKNYSFVEGELSQEEELDKCLKRNTTEKTGYIIHNLGAVYAKNLIHKSKQKLELYFLCEATEGEMKKGKKVEDLKWVKPSEVEKYLKEKFPQRLKEYILNLE